jgi:NAD(P)-dependent dehydrogenase (short-subunit alcohol dehydrogenase family)
MVDPQKVALIVGAASPLGESAAEILAEQGYFVALCDLSSEACARIEQKLLNKGLAAQAVPADASKKLAFQTMLEHLLEEHQQIDLLVNASMVATQHPFLEADEWDWRRALDMNLNSVFVATQSVGRVFRELEAGHVICVLDSAANQNSLAYQTAAAAVQAFSNLIGEELQPFNIMVECFWATPDTDQLSQRILESLQS